MVGLRKDAYAEESAEVEVLFANLDKMRTLTKKIQSSMSRLEVSGKTVQDAIGPVYGNTQRLQTTNNNIDRIMTAIDRVREPLDMRNREERIIKSNPQRTGINEYMASIDRTRQALKEMKQTNLKSNQSSMQEMQALLQAGCRQLEDVFRDVLRDSEQPVEPLNFITKGVDFPRIPGNTAAQLRTIHSYVAGSMSEMSNGGFVAAPTAQVYADVRGQYMTYSLQNLAAGCVARRKQQSGAIYQRGDNAVGTYAQALCGVICAEFDSIRQVFQQQEWEQVLLLTSQKPLQAFAIALRDIDRHVRELLLTECFLAFEVIEVVSASSVDLETRTGSNDVKQAMADACKPLRETAKAALNMFIADARNRAKEMQTAPQDAGAVGVTTDAMRRLQQLTEYVTPLASILTSLGDGGWSTPLLAQGVANSPALKSYDVGPNGTALFGNYVVDTIEQLMAGLQLRSGAAYRNKSQQGVFLANNTAVIDRMIRTSDLQILLEATRPKIDAWRKKAVALYLDAWKETSAYLLDVQYTNRPTRTSGSATIDSAAVIKSLSSKDKDAIKEKFRNFNASFDDNMQRHKAYKMEKEVRPMLAKEVSMFIEALYARFWDRYHDIDKGKGKYVKYDKTQLNAWLSSLG